MAPILSPTLKLNDGHDIPVLGLGTWQSKPGEVTQAVSDAIEAGYRHIDGARIYQNEHEVGAGIKKKLDDGTVKREELFVVNKLWDNSHHPDAVLPAIKKTLGDLGLDYLDMYLIHWPISFEPVEELIPRDAEGKLRFADIDLAETWKKMEDLVRLGLTRSIGISNFNSQQIEHILKSATIKPATNQIEMHPYFNQTKLVEFCKARGISITAYSPFVCQGSHPTSKPGDPMILDEPILTEIGKKYGKKSNHVILRWLIQKGVITIPKSVTKSRIIDNFAVFDFTLSDDDMKAVESLDKGAKGRVNTELDFKEHKGWPFGIEF